MWLSGDPAMRELPRLVEMPGRNALSTRCERKGVDNLGLDLPMIEHNANERVTACQNMIGRPGAGLCCVAR